MTKKHRSCGVCTSSLSCWYKKQTRGRHSALSDWYLLTKPQHAKGESNRPTSSLSCWYKKQTRGRHSALSDWYLLTKPKHAKGENNRPSRLGIWLIELNISTSLAPHVMCWCNKIWSCVSAKFVRNLPFWTVCVCVFRYVCQCVGMLCMNMCACAFCVCMLCVYVVGYCIAVLARCANEENYQITKNSSQRPD